MDIDPTCPAKDYYNILQVPRCATDAEIKKSYRKLVLIAASVHLLKCKAAFPSRLCGYISSSFAP